MEIKNKKPKLILVGAGPGDAELITLKGVRALQEADVILYDELVNKELLLHTSTKSIAISVGKKFGKHSFTQAEINELIVEYAFRTQGNIVRLKGGDPSVFGRATEEADYAEAFGIETEIIPGISSALAVPALQKIPLTQRGVSESFWVITGTTQSGAMSNDIVLAAQSTATVIILMGMHRLEEIVSVFQKHTDLEKPIAIIQNGSLPNEKLVIGNLGNIVEQANDQNIASPAIIVIGDTVSRHPLWKEEVCAQTFRNVSP